MKKLLLTLTLTVLIIFCYSQDRVNREKLQFKDSSQVLTEAIGWSYNKEIGEWVDYKNIIHLDKSYKKDTNDINKENACRGENFISIQSKTFNFKENLYNALIIEKWYGSHGYSSHTFRNGWRFYKRTECYIFDFDEFDKIKTFSDSVYIKVKHKIKKITLMSCSEVELLDIIQAELSEPKIKGIRATDYVFPIKKTNSGDIRFVLPQEYHKGRYKHLNNFNLNEEYFETDIENFNKIII